MSFSINRPLALFAAASLNVCSGSLYASTLLLRALEDAGALTRQAAAGGFSLSTFAFLVGVLTAPRALRLFGVQRCVVGAALMASLSLASGSVLTALGPVALLAALWSIIGLACGLYYAIAVSAAKALALNRPGFVTGLIVAAFAAGSVLWSLAAAPLIELAGPRGYLLCLALAFAATALAPGLLPRLAVSRDVERSRPEATSSVVAAIWPLWVGFFCLSAAGLVLIGHASHVATNAGLSATWLTAGLGLANGTGRLGGGLLSDRLGLRPATALLGLSMAGSLLIAALGHQGWLLALAVVCVGLIYGAGSAAFPALLMRQSAIEQFPRRFALLFTAWGAAGLIAPFVAGLYAASQGYSDALLVLATANVMAAGVALGARGAVGDRA